MRRLGESLHVKKLLDEIQSLSSSRTIEPGAPVNDWREFDPDYLHLAGLIERGDGRTLKINYPVCSCAEGYYMVRLPNPTAKPCENCYHLRRTLKRILLAGLPNDSIDAALNDYIFESEEHKSVFLHMKNYRRHKKSWNDPALRNKNYLDEFLKDVDILLFDEFGGLGGGIDQHTAWFKNTTIEFLGTVYEKFRAGQLSVVMTSNIQPKEIVTKVLNKNYSAMSRLNSMFNEPVEMRGKDRRPTFAKKGFSL
jgi:DNA replication protein DnaC